jgi:CBS domain-containing protein
MANRNPAVAYADEPLRVVVNRMADTGFTRLPVVDRENSRKLVGMVSLNDLLRARTRSLEEERQRERVLRIRLPFRSRPQQIPK